MPIGNCCLKWEQVSGLAKCHYKQPPQAMEAEEGNRHPSDHKFDNDHPGTTSMPHTHPVSALVQPQGTAIRQRRDHGSRRHKPQQALHSAKNSCAQPATAAVSSHRAQLHASEYHICSTVILPPFSQLSIASCTKVEIKFLFPFGYLSMRLAPMK